MTTAGDQHALNLTANSWRDAVALIRLMRSGDRMAALQFVSMLDSTQVSYLIGSLAALANSTLEIAAEVTRRAGGDIDVDAYLDGAIRGLAMAANETPDDNDPGMQHD